jgi:hypothetical protein
MFRINIEQLFASDFNHDSKLLSWTSVCLVSFVNILYFPLRSPQYMVITGT